MQVSGCVVWVSEETQTIHTCSLWIFFYYRINLIEHLYRQILNLLVVILIEFDTFRIMDSKYTSVGEQKGQKNKKSKKSKHAGKNNETKQKEKKQTEMKHAEKKQTENKQTENKQNGSCKNGSLKKSSENLQKARISLPVYIYRKR